MFDFQSYVAKRRADTAKRPAQIQNYAYIDDIDLQRQLSELGIVNQGVSLGLRAWRFMEGRKIQSQSKEISQTGLERNAQIWADVCFKFNCTSLPLKLIPNQKTFIEAYGDDHGSFVGLSGSASNLPVTTLKFLYGRGIGAFENGHVPYLTLLRFFDSLTRGMVSKFSQIPEALMHWTRSANITEDRAGILASQDISAAIYALMKSTLDWDDEEIMSEIRRYHEHREVDWGEADIEKRVQAIEIFMTSDLYRSGGRPIGEIDRAVRKLYSIF